MNFGQLIIEGNICSELNQLFWGKAAVKYVFSAFQFLKEENLQRLIHEFKYSGNKKLAFKMGQLLGRQINLESKFPDCISFVPMHPIKQKERGYNQAEVLAQGFSIELNIPLVQVLKRVNESESQTEKDVFERFENMEDKFQLESKIENLKHVLILDDVITTGATLAACANILLTHGIQVSILCLAYRGLNS